MSIQIAMGRWKGHCSPFNAKNLCLELTLASVTNRTDRPKLTAQSCSSSPFGSDETHRIYLALKSPATSITMGVKSADNSPHLVQELFELDRLRFGEKCTLIMYTPPMRAATPAPADDALERRGGAPDGV
ncbi:hypothetical protein ACJJTC_010103 [Scirpophaga incertulas]